MILKTITNNNMI